MKLPIKVVFLFLSLLLFSMLNAQYYETSAYEHLYEVNKQWEKHKSDSPNLKIKFKSDIDRIHFHLKVVQNHLVTHTPKNISKKRLENRFALLDTLAYYANNKTFPKNTHHSVRQPYFIDEEGTYCAVGYLMAASGNADLAQNIHDQHNYDYIKDIKTEGVTAWATKNRFSLDELAWIQPGYAPQSVIAAIGEGTNGPVNVMHNDYSSDRLFFAGDFDTVDNLPCLNIGYYKDDQLSCLGTGLSGVIRDIFTYQEEVIVIGELKHNNVTYPMAIFVDEDWVFIEIPERIGASGSTGYSSWNSDIEISISHPSIPNQQEVWSMSEDTWEKVATVDGMVLDIEEGYDNRAYVGHFSTVTVHNSNGDDDTFSAKNVVLREIYANNWYSIGTAISDTVKVAKRIGPAFYFGGSCHENDVCLTRYFNEVLQPLIVGSNFSSYENDSTTVNSINTIQLYQDNLIFGGDFKIEPMGIGIFGRNLAMYDLVQNYFSAIAYFDKPVNTIALRSNELFLGGDFTNNLGFDDMSHIAKTDLTVSAFNINQDKNIRIFPNPVDNILNIEGVDTPFTYQIFDLSGKLFTKGSTLDSKIVLHEMLSGAYILHLKTNIGLYSLKFFKE